MLTKHCAVKPKKNGLDLGLYKAHFLDFGTGPAIVFMYNSPLNCMSWQQRVALKYIHKTREKREGTFF